MYASFGAGIVSLVPSGSNPTPVPFGALQDVSIDLSTTTKSLYGANQFPLAIAAGEKKLTWKAKSGYFMGNALASFLTGSSTVTGNTAGIAGESGTVPATPYQVTVAQSATWVQDLGVIDVLGGNVMKEVASSPSTGQYSVAAGVYTFAAADTTKHVSTTYSYTLTTGHTTTLTNQLMGAATTYQVLLLNPNPLNGKPAGIKLYASVISKLSMSLKNSDFTMMDIDGEAFADSSGNVVDSYQAD